jgi:menaquinone-dependent protoporphyrinogen oxidase
MSVLIIFETVEGQTGRIARFAKKEARRAGLDVALLDTADTSRSVSFDGVEKVILAAPVHERRHPKAFETFIAENLAELAARDTLMLSVSLKAAFPDSMEEAEDFLIEMKMRTGLAPDAEALVAGAVRSKSYDYYAAMIVKHVVMRERDYELENGEREFTDWDALGKTISAFLGGAPATG